MGLKLACWLSITLLLLVLTRVVVVDRARPQGFDEPAHVAAGMEWLQFHSYHLDPLHPPLARVAAASLLYLSGVRFREATSSALPQFWTAGNSILYQGGYLKNLSLARFGMLPFLGIMLGIIFFWMKRQSRLPEALAAIVLLGTLPVVLAFSSLAYTDLPAASLQLCCILAFAEWIESPSLGYSAALGVLFGLAVLTKFTSLLYVPIACAAIILCRHFMTRGSWRGLQLRPSLRIVIVVLTMLIVVWGGYRFSIGGIDESLNLPKTQMPSFQHFPSLARGLARRVLSSDWNIPAPEMFAGLAQLWVLDKSAPDAYLFGKLKPGGWWYFFLAEVLFKTPLPFLFLAMFGCGPLYRHFVAQDWKPLVPAVAALSILIFTTTVSVDSGLRHVLIIFPLLAITAGYGAKELWNFREHLNLGRAALVVLVAWQCISVLRPGADWIGYFNELAGSDPSKIIVTGCDLDCGQDVLNLSQELRKRNAGHVSLALWTSADLENMQLPQFDVLEPFRPTPGWVAVSLRAMREGSMQHQSVPPESFSWLNGYTPVTQVGSTIMLYRVPDELQAAKR